jgi:glyoxylase-like metal-dependent hydrolase (beta-lactamase superfamily II)/rhodanese-related sulfurtransferase
MPMTTTGPAALDVVSFVDGGLGHSSYLVDLGDGRSLVIDPGRFPTGQLAAATQRGTRVAFTVDTHTHADFVSGSPELAARGAVFVAPARGRLEVPHRAVDGGDEVDLGGLTMRAIPTPGHTPDHLAYLVLDGSTPRALFSGGSLMVGTVGRTDLLGDEQREGLARALFRALHDDVLTLPDDLPVFPTHGAGSFCSSPAGPSRTTTIGRERATNPLLQTDDEDAFVAMLLAGFGSFPAYFRRLPERNRVGVRVYGDVPPLERLGVDETVALVRDGGAVVVDARPVEQFAAGHVPGAVSIALRPVFGSWLGWILPDDVPLVFVLDDDQDRGELVRQALNVGYEQLAGELDGGMRARRAAGHDVALAPRVGPDEMREDVLDVRQRDEYRTGHVPGARHVELGALAGMLEPGTSTGMQVDDRPVTVMCGHGERAATGASLLERAGLREVTVFAGGPEDWARATGIALVTGA